MLKLKINFVFLWICWLILTTIVYSLFFFTIANSETFKPLTLQEQTALLEQHREILERSLPQDFEKDIEKHQTETQPIVNEAQKRAEKIKQNNFLSGYEYYSGHNQQKEKKDGELYNGKNTELIIFVSSSMGIDAIREYIRDADKSNLISSKKVLLRGFIEGAKSVQPTIKFLHRLIEEFEIKDVEIEIDPTLFKKYEVNAVPTFIVKETDPTQTSNDDGSLNPAFAEYRLQGHISLTKIFEILETVTNEGKYKKIQHEISKGFFF